MKTESSEKWVVCRVCLKTPNDSDELLQDIFSQNANTRLDQMLHICAGIPVSIDDNYPDKMCSKCVRYLRLSYKFRMECQRSHQHITDMLASEAIVIGGDAVAISTTDEFNAESILRAWEDDISDIKEEKIEDLPQEQILSYVIANENGEETVVYDNLIEETNAPVAYDGAQAEDDDAAESYAEYEELEMLGTETPRAMRIVYSEDLDESPEADDDVANDVLSSDDESYMPEAKIKARVLNRVRQQRQPRKIQQKLKTNVDDDVRIKKMGRKPRDKNTNYICDVCGNIYPTQARLTEHMKFHSGIKPHECEICGRGFVQNQQLVRHMNTHTGNRPYKCNFCPAAFADRSTKTKHHRIHTKERPYECDVCQKTFTYSDNLKFHKMIHTGEKPHICDICGKGFVKAYKMRLHRVTHEKRGWKQMATQEIKDELSEIVIA